MPQLHEAMQDLVARIADELNRHARPGPEGSNVENYITVSEISGKLSANIRVSSSDPHAQVRTTIKFLSATVDDLQQRGYTLMPLEGSDEFVLARLAGPSSPQMDAYR